MNLGNQILCSMAIVIVISFVVGSLVRKNGLRKKNEKKYRRFLLSYTLSLLVLFDIPFFMLNDLNLKDKVGLYLVMAAIITILWFFKVDEPRRRF